MSFVVYILASRAREFNRTSTVGWAIYVQDRSPGEGLLIQIRLRRVEVVSSVPVGRSPPLIAQQPLKYDKYDHLHRSLRQHGLPGFCEVLKGRSSACPSEGR